MLLFFQLTYDYQFEIEEVSKKIAVKILLT